MDLLCKGVAEISKHYYYGMMVILMILWNSSNPNLNCVEIPKFSVDPVQF